MINRAAVLLLALSIPLCPMQAGAQRACGVERWRVKILADKDRGRVSWTPETTSVAALRQIRRSRESLPPASRIAPYELTLYRVHAIVRQILPESDGDWHIVLADPESGCGSSKACVARSIDTALS